MIFERESDSMELGDSINKKSINTSVNPKMPYLSFLAINYDIETINEVILLVAQNMSFHSLMNQMVQRS